MSAQTLDGQGICQDTQPCRGGERMDSETPSVTRHHEKCVNGNPDEDEGSQDSSPLSTPHHDVKSQMKEQEDPSQDDMGLTRPLSDEYSEDASDSGEAINGRERLKRHRREVAGQVWIPEIWGQEELLMDWVDCSVFDSSLVPSKIMSAKAALVEEGRRATSSGLSIENRC